MMGVGKMMDYSVIEALFDALPEVVLRGGQSDAGRPVRRGR
jgi:hypothetical protein